MAEENIIGSIGTTAWSWWLGLLTALDPNTLNDPIMATISALVFGVVFYIILAIVFERFRDQLGDRAEGILKWATLLMTVGFVLAMIYDGMVYIASTMISLITIVGVVGFGLMVLYFFYAHAKKGIGAAAAVSRSAGRSPIGWARGVGKEIRRSYKSKKEAMAEEKVRELENTEILKTLKNEIEREAYECKIYYRLKELFVEAYSRIGTAPAAALNKYFKDIRERLANLLVDEAREKKLEKRKDEVIGELISHSRGLVVDLSDEIRDAFRAVKDESKLDADAKKIFGQLKKDKAKLEGIDYATKVEKAYSKKIDTKIKKYINQNKEDLKSLIKLLEKSPITMYGYRKATKLLDKLYQDCISVYKLMLSEYKKLRKEDFESTILVKRIRTNLDGLIQVIEKREKAATRKSKQKIYPQAGP